MDNVGFNGDFAQNIQLILRTTASKRREGDALLGACHHLRQKCRHFHICGCTGFRNTCTSSRVVAFKYSSQFANGFNWQCMLKTVIRNKLRSRAIKYQT